MFTRDSKILSNRLTTPITSVANAVGDVFKPTYNQIIKSLFSNGEQGFAYDPNDLSTMFQDAAGTVPVTAAGQPVGLILDKSKGLVLGGELWSDGAVTLIGESQRVSSGVYRIYSSAGAHSALSIVNSLVVGSLYKLTFNIDSITTLGAGLTNEGNPASIFNTLGRNTVYFFATSPTFSIKRTASACDIQVSGFSLKKIAGNHAYQTTSAARPILRQNATTGAYYLEFDGSDDFLVTNSINFTSTDKVSLFAGIRKLSDAAAGALVELGPNTLSNDGTFAVFTPGTATLTTFRAYSRGTITSSNNGAATNPAPNSFVGTSFMQISTDTNKTRIDGVDRSSVSTDQGVGNYGNHPLYIGRRAGNTFPFNGHIYSLIGIGRLTTDSETTAIEKELAKLVGVTLNV